MKKIHETPATGTHKRFLEFKGGSWFIVLPDVLGSGRLCGLRYYADFLGEVLVLLGF
jgi:hypothetical protein